MTYESRALVRLWKFRLVSQGQLPAVADRLPATPQVVNSPEASSYSEIYRAAFYSADDWLAFQQHITADGLVRFDSATERISPALAEAWQWSADETEVTLNLRQGVKWSDGTPFTTQDIQFWFNDIQRNPNVTRTVPIDEYGFDAALTVIDPYTLKFEFSSPVSSDDLHRTQGAWNMVGPAHYYRNFHPQFNPNIDGYHQLLEKIAEGPFTDPNRPVVQAWKLVDVEPGVGVVAERNPYYWKVDRSGRQLPYIDVLDFAVEWSPVAPEDSLSELLNEVSRIPLDTSGGSDLRSLVEMAGSVLDLVSGRPDVYSPQEIDILDAELRFLRGVARRLQEVNGDTEKLPRREQRILAALSALFRERSDTLATGTGRASMAVWVAVAKGRTDAPSNGLRVYLQPPFRRSNGQKLPAMYIARSQIDGKVLWAQVACYYATDEWSRVVTDVVMQKPVYVDGLLKLEVEITDWGPDSLQGYTDDACV